jgi:hypothetical protein
MKIVVLIVRLLLGLVFFVFGLNAFLQFLKGPIPGGLAGQFLQALFQSHYGLAIGAVQAVGGALQWNRSCLRRRPNRSASEGDGLLKEEQGHSPGIGLV